jgi:hypothetical protein
MSVIIKSIILSDLMQISLAKLYRCFGGMYYFRLQCRIASQPINKQAASKVIRAILPFLHRSNNILLGPAIHQGIGPLYGCIAEFCTWAKEFQDTHAHTHTHTHTHTQGGSYLSWPLHGYRCTSGCEAHKNFADESICRLADNVRSEVITIHRSQKVLKMLSLSTVDRSQRRRHTVESNCKNEPCWLDSAAARRGFLFFYRV